MNCSGLLTRGLVSILKPAVLCDPRLVESADAEPGMQRSRGCGRYMQVSDCVENQIPAYTVHIPGRYPIVWRISAPTLKVFEDELYINII